MNCLYLLQQIPNQNINIWLIACSTLSLNYLIYLYQFCNGYFLTISFDFSGKMIEEVAGSSILSSGSHSIQVIILSCPLHCIKSLSLHKTFLMIDFFEYEQLQLILFLLWPRHKSHKLTIMLNKSKGKNKEKAVVEIEDDDNSSPKEEISGSNMPLLKLFSLCQLYSDN